MNMRVVDGQDFASVAESVLSEVREKGNLVHVTEEGQKPVYVVSGDSEHVLALLEQIEILKRLESGIGDAKAGRLHSAEEVLDTLPSR